MELNPSYLFDFSKEAPPFLTSQDCIVPWHQIKVCTKYVGKDHLILKNLVRNKPPGLPQQSPILINIICTEHTGRFYQELIMVILFLLFPAVRWFLFVLWSMHQCLWSWMGSTTHYLQVERCEALSSLHCIIPLDSLDMLSTIHLTFTKMCH